MKNYKIEKPTIFSDKTPVVIMLHGVGSNKEDLWPLLESYRDRIIRISIQGTIDYGQGFAYFLPDPHGNTSKEVILKGMETVKEEIDGILLQEDLKTHPVYFFGFSQGAMLSQALLAEYPDRFLGGVLSHSRFLDFLDPHAELNPMRVMIIQGDYDPLFPAPHGERIAQYFMEHHAEVTYKHYPVGHGLSQTALDDILLWFNEFL